MARPTQRPPTVRPSGAGGRPPAPPGPAVQHRAWAALTLGVLSLLGLSLTGSLGRAVYVFIVTLFLGVLAIWLGGSAIARARRGGTARPRGAVAGIVLGSLGLAFSAIFLIGFAVFWPQLSAYSKCLSGANTVSAQQACQHQFTQSITSQIQSLQGGG